MNDNTTIERDDPDTERDREEEEILVRVDEKALREAGLTIDDTFSVLSNRRRRKVLQFLKRDEGAAMTVRDLSELIAADENETTRNELNYNERKRVYTSLHQNHLPKMADLGLIDYDRTAGEVKLREYFNRLSVWLTFDETFPDESRSRGPRSTVWPLVYGVLAIAALGVAFGVSIGVPPFGAVSPTGLVGVVAFVFLAAGAAHFISAVR